MLTHQIIDLQNRKKTQIANLRRNSATQHKYTLNMPKKSALSQHLLNYNESSPVNCPISMGIDPDRNGIEINRLKNIPQRNGINR